MPRRSAMLAKAWSFARITWPVAGAQTFAAGSCSESFLGDLEQSDGKGFPAGAARNGSDLRLIEPPRGPSGDGRAAVVPSADEPSPASGIRPPQAGCVPVVQEGFDNASSTASGKIS